MSRILCPCVVCGNRVGGREHPEDDEATLWLSKFRGVYNHHGEGYILTGVCFSIEPEEEQVGAPPANNSTWDDEGYKIETENGTFNVVTSRSKRTVGMGFLYMTFVGNFFPPTATQKRLHEICSSVYINGTALNWVPPAIEDVIGLEIAFHNPLRASEATNLLDQEPENLQPIADIPNLRESAGNRLDQLPQELIEMIAKELPTQDFLNTRLATRSFWPMFHTQSFWRTRFTTGGERSWLFEALNTHETIDWRSLYLKTNESRLTLGLRNRKRI
ncbi:unnamed protein product [Clonostachys chloroleuca]|uniref:F-box domain-containing protein n=1 Tax=Clonostachys chloroleuca TaxID=1926264 RepID=A0AA35LS87_9HYPO|nr:unnamed protein product [Clonostachys chloroleuca]